MRRGSQILPLRARTTAFYNSFFLSSARDWNSLPLELLASTSLNSFKILLKKVDAVSTKSLYQLDIAININYQNHVLAQISLYWANGYTYTIMTKHEEQNKTVILHEKFNK